MENPVVFGIGYLVVVALSVCSCMIKNKVGFMEAFVVIIGTLMLLLIVACSISEVYMGVGA